MVSVLAALAASAVTSASASAAVCTVEAGGTIPTYCTSATKEDVTLTGEEVATKGGVFKLIVVGGPSFECSAETGTTKVSSTESGAATGAEVHVTFTGCKVIGNPKCTTNDNVNEIIGTIVVPATTSVLKLEGGNIYAEFIPPPGKPFVTIEIDNKPGENCTVKSPEPGLDVSGHSCGLASTTLAAEAPLVFSKANEIACKATEKLKLGLKEAWLEGTANQTLTGASKGQEWAVMLT
jgi:hypothetical protein